MDGYFPGKRLTEDRSCFIDSTPQNEIEGLSRIRGNNFVRKEKSTGDLCMYCRQGSQFYRSRWVPGSSLANSSEKDDAAALRVLRLFSSMGRKPMYQSDTELSWMSRERNAELLRQSEQHRLARRALEGRRRSGQRLASWMGTQLILLGQRLKEENDA